MGNRMRRGKMEKYMEQTMIKIDMRIPEVLRAAFGMPRTKPPLLPGLPGQQDEAANLAAALLAPRGDDGASSSNPTDFDEPETEPEGDLGMVFASSYIKRHDEDAHFGHAEAGVIGVADGVGAYRSEGVDASAFSRALMHNAYADVATNAVPGTRFCPHALLERAYQATAAARAPGASTAAIVSLAGRRTLKWAFVGDSGFVVLRDGRILLRSLPQQRRYNCPYQLCSSQQDSNRVADAAVGEIAAKEGDIVILGTDGLFDNVFDDEIERMVRMGNALGFPPDNMAEVIAGFACEVASCVGRDTPYSNLRRTQPGKDFFMGGKPDYITVVVAYITIGSDTCSEVIHIDQELDDVLEFISRININ